METCKSLNSSPVVGCRVAPFNSYQRYHSPKMHTDGRRGRRFERQISTSSCFLEVTKLAHHRHFDTPYAYKLSIYSALRHEADTVDTPLTPVSIDTTSTPPRHHLDTASTPPQHRLDTSDTSDTQTLQGSTSSSRSSSSCIIAASAFSCTALEARRLVSTRSAPTR